MIDLDKNEIPHGTDKEDYLSSLKSIETENKIDKIFYRKIGYKLAKRLVPTGISPNTVTVISIVFGVLAGPFFYLSPIAYIWGVLGILCLVIANILDCVDGQLSRLTGKKSNIGRILDGVAGDLWFISIYISLAARLVQQFDNKIFILVAILSMLSHFIQAALTDYYKTLHLLFVSPEKGKEFQSAESVRKKYESMTKPIDRVFYLPYMYYTKLQMRVTPKLQSMLQKVKSVFPGFNVPEKDSQLFRKGSIIVMKLVDLLTFNGRSMVLFISVLIQQLWIYFAYEIVVLNIVFVVSRLQHETLSQYYGEYITSKFGTGKRIERG